MVIRHNPVHVASLPQCLGSAEAAIFMPQCDNKPPVTHIPNEQQTTYRKPIECTLEASSGGDLT